MVYEEFPCCLVSGRLQVLLMKHIEMLHSYNEVFCFPTYTEKLHSLNANELRNVRKNVETALMEANMKQSDVNHEK
jgi:hypothetical protein